MKCCYASLTGKLVDSFTRKASTILSILALENGVRIIKNVPVLAVCLLRSRSRWPFTSQYIHAIRHRFNVQRIDASPIATHVVKDQTVRYGADQIFVGPTMSKRSCGAITPSEFSVSVGIEGCSPLPATVRLWLNFSPERCDPLRLREPVSAHRKTDYSALLSSNDTGSWSF